MDRVRYAHHVIIYVYPYVRQTALAQQCLKRLDATAVIRTVILRALQPVETRVRVCALLIHVQPIVHLIARDVHI